jgi:polar amino acid transport system permease protein
MTEIVRAGILSIDHGQTEAAKSLGMTYFKLMRRIILPQAARVIIPPLGNEFNAMLKNTTLLSVIGVPEMMQVTETQISATFRSFELLSVIALYYLTLTTLWGFAQRALDRRFGEAKGSRAQNESMVGRLRRLLMPSRDVLR